MASKKPNRARKSNSLSSTSHSRNLSAQKTEITINVYDLLPPGRLSSLLWTIGGSLLHSGIVINQREYAYGGHSKRSITGVYYTSPRFIPPGGTFRLSILQGFTFKTEAEIAQSIKDVSEEFLGPSYNLLTNNCNHFTNALCVALTGKQAPAWLNRAASIGLALPCVVPREWIAPPDVETADGELLAEDDEYEDEHDFANSNERASMLAADRRQKLREEERRRRGQKFGKSRRGSAAEVRRTSKASTKAGGSSESAEDSEGERFGESLAGGRKLTDNNAEPPPRLVSIPDSSGRPLPVAERAPIPKATTTTG